MAERRYAAGLGMIVGVLVWPQTSQARVQEYQIIRLLSYRSECQLVKLENRSGPTGPMRFFASCENVSFYPDGIEIVCADRDDEQSCRLLTKEKTFDSLNLLRQKDPQDQNR